ncbi:MAG: hemerythrin domain-containing protein [Ignavibacteriaceae bacterium]|nr:hemerythrin domain-containing protein [Ignavibacteriaceae bacterium]
MKRHPALIPLSQDHHKALLLAQLLKRNAPEYHGLPKDLIGKMNFAKEIYHTELEHHFRDEEQFVFPFLKEKDAELDNLISEILNEHIILKEKILSLVDNPNLIDQLDEIGNILGEHVRKEERILFEKAQTILSDDELKIIENKFDESRPKNKSCLTT